MRVLLEQIKKDYPLVWCKIVEQYNPYFVIDGMTSLPPKFFDNIVNTKTYHQLECFFDENEIYITLDIKFDKDYNIDTFVGGISIGKAPYGEDYYSYWEKTRAGAKQIVILKAAQILENKLKGGL